MRLLFLLLWLLLPLTACSLGERGEASAIITPQVITTAPPAAAYENLSAFVQAEMPPRDLVDLTRRFRGVRELPAVAHANPPAYQVGDVVAFWIKNHDDEVNQQIEARLVYRSDGLNLWLQLDEKVRPRTLHEAARRLEEEILPRNRQMLGHEWQPGIDGDNRVNILHSPDLGSGVVGYFSAADEFVTAVNPYSNQMEMLYINLQNAPIGSQAYYEVVAHEMAHMIHWHHDQNESAWVEEGLAVLAAYLNGFNDTGFDRSFAAQPDVQLTDFSQFDGASGAHYGASFLFAAYFLDRLGDEALQAWIGQEENGIAGIEAILPAAGLPDFDALFADWAAATYLQSLERGAGIYAYQELAVPKITPANEHDRFPAQQTGVVAQYGVDYVTIASDEPVTLVFTGTQQVKVLDVAPYSRSAYWSSYPADNGDMTLTQAFDLTGLTQATLKFRAWYEMEAGWDYAYVAISADDGLNWQPLPASDTTLSDPQGNSYGAALTGRSGGGAAPVWTEQTADLSPYAGQRVLLRFEYVTDQAVHLAGLALDDIRIPELNFYDDAETAGGWQAAGFVHHSNVLPQSFLVQLILLGPAEVRVQPLPLDEQQRGEWTLPLSEAFDQAVLTISGSTLVTTMPASYAYELHPLDSP